LHRERPRSPCSVYVKVAHRGIVPRFIPCTTPFQEQKPLSDGSTLAQGISPVGIAELRDAVRGHVLNEAIPDAAAERDVDCQLGVGSSQDAVFEFLEALEVAEMACSDPNGLRSGGYARTRHEKGHPRRWPKFMFSGSPGRTRTADLVINSHPLYRLSYRGMGRRES